MTLAETYKRIFEDMCGLDDHNFKQVRHQVIASTVEVDIIGPGVVCYSLKDNSQLTLNTKNGLEVIAR